MPKLCKATIFKNTNDRQYKMMKRRVIPISRQLISHQKEKTTEVWLLVSLTRIIHKACHDAWFKREMVLSLLL